MGVLATFLLQPPPFIFTLQLCHVPPNSGTSMQLRQGGLCPCRLQDWVTEGKQSPSPWQLCFPHLSTLPSRWLTAGLMRTVRKGRRGHTATVGNCGPCLPWAPLGGGSRARAGTLGGSWGQAWWCLCISPFCQWPLALSHPLALWRFEGLVFVLYSQGIKTGQCVEFNGTHRTCEIQGWCPVESGTVPM